MAIKDVIKKIRMEAQLSQSEFAKIMKISTSTASLWESGQRLPNYKSCRQLVTFAKKRNIALIFDELRSVEG
jgi:DNA-binding transcriptional regulator YiaG